MEDKLQQKEQEIAAVKEEIQAIKVKAKVFATSQNEKVHCL
jgi:hypothetical protein